MCDLDVRKAAGAVEGEYSGRSNMLTSYRSAPVCSFHKCSLSALQDLTFARI